MRKFFLIGMMVIVCRGSILQITIGTVANAAYLMMLLQAQPYKHRYDNYLAQGSSFGLLMVFFACVLYKYESLVASDDLRVKMSFEQREYFSVPSLVLSRVLFLGVLSSFLIAGVLVSIQVGLNRRRWQSEFAKKLLASVGPRRPNRMLMTNDAACGSCEPQAGRNRSAQPSEDEVELVSMPTAEPVQRGRTLSDIEPGNAQQLPRPRPRRRSSAERDEMRVLASRGSREHPPSHRLSGRVKQLSQHTESELQDESDSPSSGVVGRASGVVGRARGNSLAEEPSTCWLAMPTSAEAGASKTGATQASGVSRLSA